MQEEVNQEMKEDSHDDASSEESNELIQSPASSGSKAKGSVLRKSIRIYKKQADKKEQAQQDRIANVKGLKKKKQKQVKASQDLKSLKNSKDDHGDPDAGAGDDKALKA